MEECMGAIKNQYAGSIIAQLLDSSGNITDETRIDNAVMDFTNPQWQQAQKLTWMYNLADGQNGGGIAGPQPFYPNSNIILTQDSTTPDSQDPYINGRLLTSATRYVSGGLSNLKPTLCKRSDNQARWVFEWSPLEANGTFQSVSWGQMDFSRILVNTMPEYIKFGAIISGSTVFYDGTFIYHFYTEGTPLVTQLWFARTDPATGLRTNLFRIRDDLFNSSLTDPANLRYQFSNFNILKHGDDFIFYRQSNSNAYVYNSQGDSITRSGTSPNFTYSFTANAQSPFNLGSSGVFSLNVGTNRYVSDGERVYIFPTGTSRSMSITTQSTSNNNWGALLTSSSVTVDTLPTTSSTPPGTDIIGGFSDRDDPQTFTLFWDVGTNTTVDDWDQLVARTYRYTVSNNTFSLTTTSSLRKGRDYRYWGSSSNFISLFGYTTGSNNDNYRPGSSLSAPYSDMRYKSNISGYEVLGLEIEGQSYSTPDGLSRNAARFYGLNYTNPSVVSTRALLPSPFTKTSDKTLRITYDINFT
jgi:hypothetical protein